MAETESLMDAESWMDRTLEDVLEEHKASVRLRNCIFWAREGRSFPYSSDEPLSAVLREMVKTPIGDLVKKLRNYGRHCDAELRSIMRLSPDEEIRDWANSYLILSWLDNSPNPSQHCGRLL